MRSSKVILIFIIFSSSKDLNNFIINNLKISHFNILLENGEKISKKKIHKIEEILTKNANEKIQLLLITADIPIWNKNQNRIWEEETKLFSNSLDKNNNNFNLFVKNFSSLAFISHEIKKIDNQNIIMNFLKNFYINMIEKLNIKLNVLSECFTKGKISKEDLEKNFSNYINNFKEMLMKNLKDDSNEKKITQIESDIKSIEKSFIDFKKTFTLFKEKYDYFNSKLNDFKDRKNNKLKDHCLEILNQDTQGVAEKIKNIHSEIINCLTNFNSSNFREILVKFENLCDGEKFFSKSEKFLEISKTKVKILINK